MPKLNSSHFYLSDQAAADLPLAEQAYHEIRGRILDNVWTPGYQALEQEVAQALGMSRTPIREALMRLQQEGLIEIAPRRGMRVLPVSPKDMREIYEILTALECMATELLSKQKLTLALLKPLVKATEEMEKSLAQDDLDRWARADERFHFELVRLAGNRMLLETVMGYWDRAHRARLFTLRLRPKPSNSTREHMELVELMAAGDAVGASKKNRQHRERASRELLEIFERFQLQRLKISFC